MNFGFHADGFFVSSECFSSQFYLADNQQYIKNLHKSALKEDFVYFFC